MPISTRCPGCGKDYQLADEQAGHRVRCRECKNEFEVPRRPEVLEVVTKRPVAPRQDAPPWREEVLDDEPIGRPVARPAGNRTLLYVLGGLAVGGLLMMLACGGVLWMFMLRFGTTVQQVAKEVPKAAPVQPAPAPAPIQPEAVAAAWPEIIPKIKDLDDALAKLKSPDPRTRIAAVDYIGRQKPPADPARKKMILDALEPLTNDDDVFVRGAASLAKINWGGFDF